MAGKRIKKIVVTGVGTPPPLPLRPLVDKVLRAMEQQRRTGTEARALPDLGDSSRQRPKAWVEPSLTVWIQVRSVPQQGPAFAA